MAKPCDTHSHTRPSSWNADDNVTISLEKPKIQPSYPSLSSTFHSPLPNMATSDHPMAPLTDREPTDHTSTDHTPTDHIEPTSQVAPFSLSNVTKSQVQTTPTTGADSYPSEVWRARDVWREDGVESSDMSCNVTTRRPSEESPSPIGPSDGGVLSPSTASALTLTNMEMQDPKAIYIEWPECDGGNPFNWPKHRRWSIVLVCFAFTALTGINGTGYVSAADVVSKQFNSSSLVFLTGNTTYLFAVSITPMVLAPLSEVYGRTPIYLVASLVFTLFYIPQALAQNMTTIIVSRWFQGMAASVGNSMVAGSVSDLFHASERGLPMSIYSLTVYMAQGVSPYLSSVTITYSSWRIMFWWNAGLSVAVFAAMFFVLKETRGPVLLSARAKKLTSETGKLHQCRADDERVSFWIMAKHSLVRPFEYLILEPVVLSFALWVGFLWGLLFLSLEAVPIVFSEYHWSSDQQRLALLSIALGGLLGFATNFHQERLYAKQVVKSGGKPAPEARLTYACIGAIVAPIGLFIFAWTGRPGIHPAGPIISLVVYNWALFPIYVAVFSYLADVYERYASSALAAQSFIRNMLASVFPLFARQTYDKLTPPIASTVLACIAAVLGIVPFFLIRYGDRIRKHSKAAAALEKEEDLLRKQYDK